MDLLKEELKRKAMELISSVSSAKSTYLIALECAKNGDLPKAKATLEKGRVLFSKAHALHFDLVAKEAQGEDLPFSLILMHAEDQMSNTETIEILVTEMITLYENIKKS